MGGVLRWNAGNSMEILMKGRMAKLGSQQCLALIMLCCRVQTEPIKVEFKKG